MDRRSCYLGRSRFAPRNQATSTYGRSVGRYAIPIEILGMNNEREDLIGFVKTTYRFLFARGSQGSVILDEFGKVDWSAAPINGIRQAASDAVEMCIDLTGQALSELDAQLDSSGFPTLTAMRYSTYRRAFKVLSRGEIRSDTEWYLLNTLVSSTDETSLSNHERTVAEQLLGKYRSPKRL